MQIFVDPARKHTKIMMGREFTFFSGRRVNFSGHLFANTLLRCSWVHVVFPISEDDRKADTHTHKHIEASSATVARE